jgi:long-chain acyl-CoA synthetase
MQTEVPSSRILSQVTVNLAHFLARAARVFPDRPAVSHGERVVATYSQLARRAARLAFALRHTMNVPPGANIALAMSNCPQYIELLYAAWWAGLTAVPINARLHAEEAAYILEHAEARVCFVTSDLLTTIGALEGRVPGLERIVAVGSADYRAITSARRHGVAVLHKRDHRATQGCDDHAPESARDDIVLLRRRRRDSSG